MKQIKLVTCIALLLVLLPVGLASASPAIHIEGRSEPVQLQYMIPEPHANGNKCLIDMGYTFRLVGDTMDIVCPAELEILAQAPCESLPGPYLQIAKVHAVCEGMVVDREGTLELKGAQQSDPDKAYPLQKQFTLSGLTGELSTLHGMVHVTGIPAVGGTYEGIVTFGPDE
jgi:hypothetical protein